MVMHYAPLRYTLPLGFLGLSALLIVGAYWLRHHEIEERNATLMLQRATGLGQLVVPQLQGTFPPGARDPGREVLARLAVVPHLKAAFVCADDGRILAATLPAAPGRLLPEMEPAARALFAGRGPARVPRFVPSEAGNTLWAAFPFELDRPRDAAPTLGWFCTASDVAGQNAPAIAAQHRGTALLAAGICAICAGLWFYFDRAVTRRATALAAATRTLAAGRLETRVSLAGTDELAQLGAAFNQMAGELEERAVAARRTEQRATEAIRASGQGTWEWAMQQGTYPDDSGWRRILGYDRGEIAPTVAAWRNLIHPENLPAVDAAMARLREPGTLRFAVEYRSRHRNGTWVWVHDLGETVERDGQDSPLRIVGTCRDVTERVQAAAAVRESRETYFGLFNSVTEAIYVHDEHGVFLDVNDGACRMYGWPRAELIGKTPALVAAPGRNDLAAVAAQTAAVFRTGVPAEFEFWGRRRNGEEFPKACITHRGRHFGRDVLITTARDITEQERAKAAMADRERQLHAMVDASPACVKLVARDGTLLSMNRVGLAMIEADSAESVIGRNVYDLIAPEYRDEFRRLNERVCDGEKAAAEFQIVATSGVRRWVETWAVPFASDRHGGIVQLAVTRDISDRKTGELVRRRLARAVEQSPVNIVITDPSGTIEYVNPHFTRVTGYTAAEVLGRNPRLLKSGMVPDRTYHELWTEISAGRDWHGELCNRRKDGTHFWVDASITPILDEAGHIVHFLAVEEDVTDRRAAREQLREQAALLDVTQDAIFVLTLEHRITYCNRSAMRLYGLPREQLVGRRYPEVCQPAAGSQFEADWHQLITAGSTQAERRHSAPGGREITVQVRATLLRDDAGRPHSALLVITDVTDAKQLELQYLRAQRMESLGALASGVAHDLNNVLTPILMASDMLRQAEFDPPTKEMIRLIGDSARRGADIVRQLLLYGRGSDTPRAPVDPGSVVRELGRLMQETFPKNIALDIKAPRDLWTIEADRTQIHQLVLNLCVNARDAMPAGGALHLEAKNVRVDEPFAALHMNAKPGQHVAIRVADTGVGIPAANLEKIFDPFFTTKPVGKGTGLGLASALGIARSHGGFVQVESEPGRGTVFTVYLPAQPSAAVRQETETKTLALQGRGELVLVVDDEIAVRTVVERAFQRSNYRVVVAGNGAEGLALFVQHAPHVRLIVTDVMMPIMDGIQFAHAVRRIEPQLPILAVSGLPEQRHELESTCGHNLRFVPKPFLVDDLLRNGRELIDLVHPQAAD